jgi:hypothetical protein
VIVLSTFSESGTCNAPTFGYLGHLFTAQKVSGAADISCSALKSCTPQAGPAGRRGYCFLSYRKAVWSGIRVIAMVIILMKNGLGQATLCRHLSFFLFGV